MLSRVFRLIELEMVLTEIAWDATVGFGRLRLESLIEVALGGAEG